MIATEHVLKHRFSRHLTSLLVPRTTLFVCGGRYCYSLSRLVTVTNAFSKKSQRLNMEFRVPVHAVYVELEIPDRFFVKDVWELEDESSADQCDVLEGVASLHCVHHRGARLGGWEKKNGSCTQASYVQCSRARCFHGRQTSRRGSPPTDVLNLCSLAVCRSGGRAPGRRSVVDGDYVQRHLRPAVQCSQVRATPLGSFHSFPALSLSPAPHIPQPDRQLRGGFVCDTVVRGRGTYP